MHWRRFGKLDLNEKEAIIWISEKQRIKVSIDYADEEDILESFLSLGERVPFSNSVKNRKGGESISR
jgi:hypothetical protein